MKLSIKFNSLFVLLLFGVFAFSQEKFTVVIDAGHGGIDAGATNETLSEKDIVLNIAKHIFEMNSNQDLEIILSRDEDLLLPLKKRVEFTNEKQPDLFLSLHVNKAEDKNKNGVEIFTSTKNKNYDKSKNYANMLSKNIENQSIKYAEHNFLLLHQNDCPSILVELGYISNVEDANRLNSAIEQQNIASQILKFLESASKKS